MGDATSWLEVLSSWWHFWGLSQNPPAVVSGVMTLCGSFSCRLCSQTSENTAHKVVGHLLSFPPSRLQDTAGHKETCPLKSVSHRQKGRKATLKGALVIHLKPQQLGWMEPTAWNVLQPGLPWPWSPLDWLLIGWLWVARCNGLHVILWTSRAPTWHAAFCDWLLKDLVKVEACRGGRAPAFPWCIISWNNITDTAVAIREERRLQAPEFLLILSTWKSPLLTVPWLEPRLCLFFYPFSIFFV